MQQILHLVLFYKDSDRFINRLITSFFCNIRVSILNPSVIRSGSVCENMRIFKELRQSGNALSDRKFPHSLIGLVFSQNLLAE